MDICRETSSQWMTEFHNQLVRGKHVLLHGNVADQFLLNGEYCSLAGFLDTYFRSEGFEVVGRYDIADGLRLVSPDMQPVFQGLINARRRTGGGAVSPMGEPAPRAANVPAGGAHGCDGTPISPSTGRAPSSPATIPPGPQPTMAPSSASQLPSFRSVDEAVRAIRLILAQAEVPAAMIMDFADMLVSDPERQDDSEREVLTQLKKTMQSARILTAGPLQGRRNALVIVAGHLGAVPRWLYVDNPMVALVHVPRPSREERQCFLRRFIANFHEGSPISAERLRRVTEEFSDITDGLTCWDLESIRRTSLAEQISIQRPKKLVDYFKYGRRDDPWENLDPAKIRKARGRLQSRVIGQPQAIEAVLKTLACAVGGISSSGSSGEGGQPKGVLWFCGPTGVGKTELAKALTELIFGDESAFARFDMSEYKQEHSTERLTGSPPGYVGFEQGGQLTGRCLERPFSLFLFDEIDKAHPRVLDLFLQILEDGRLTDSHGKTAFFSKACLVFTSNIGGSTLEAAVLGSDGQLPEYSAIRDHYLAQVRRHFVDVLGRPELLNRLGDNIVVFDIVRPESMPAICRKFLAALTASAREKRDIQLEFGDEVVEMICGLMCQGENFTMGGRRIKTLVREHIEAPLNRWILLNGPEPGQRLVLGVEDDSARILINGERVPNDQ